MQINQLPAASSLNNQDKFAVDTTDGITKSITASQLVELTRTNSYGAPLVAGTAAAMTDTSKVYVYTGNETGYTNGDWYYYNGTAWVSGGAYNSVAVNTDKTLRLSGVAADAKAVGDANAALSADILTVSGDLEEATEKIYSDIATDYDNLTWPVSAGQYCIYLGRTYKANQDIPTIESWNASHWTRTNLGEGLSDLGDVQGDIAGLQAAIASEASARQAADTSLNNAISAEASAREATDTALNGSIIAEATAREAADDELNSAMTNIKDALEASYFNNTSYFGLFGILINGTLFSGDPRPNVKYRVCSPNLFEFEEPITLDVSPGFKFALHKFSNGEFSEDTGWKTTTYDVAANTQFKIIIARTSEDKSEVANIPLFDRQVHFRTGVQKAIAGVPNHFYRCVSTIYDNLLEQGNIDAGADSSFAQLARARSDYLLASNDIVIEAKIKSFPNAAAYIYYYDYQKTYLGNSGWQEIYTIPRGSIFRIVLSRNRTSTSAVSVADNYSSFNIYGSLKGNTQRLCKSVSHQGNVNSIDNHCRAEGYIIAGLQGFDYAECDVKFTSDDIPVCSHDGSFVDATTGNGIRIESYTFEQLQAFDFYGGKIAKLDEIAYICKKYGVGLYLDQMNPNWSSARYDALFAVINKYRLLDSCKFIVYDLAAAQAILSRCETAWIVCGQPSDSQSPDSAIALADSVITDHNKVDVMLSHSLGVSVIQNAAQTMDSRYGLNIYILDTAKKKAEFAPFATSITTNGDSYVYE